MKPIDFDRRFQLYALDWLKRHPGLKEDEVDERYNEMLAEWREKPADWLDGATPATYFQRFSDAEELAALLPAYAAAGIDVPEPLYSRLRELGAASVSPLLALAADADQGETVRATALSLLSDIGTDAALPLCVRLVAEAEEPTDLAEAAARIVRQAGYRAGDAMLAAYEDATDCGREALLDLLCELPGVPGVYELAEYALINHPDKRALYANDLAKLGDERAIDVLKRLAEAADLAYFDYLEIVNAIEALGGDVDYVREFYGDPDYEAMRTIE